MCQGGRQEGGNKVWEGSVHKHTVHVHMEMCKKRYGTGVICFILRVVYKRTSRRHIRRNRSFQYEGPQVPQVTYGKGREGNAFVSQCLPSVVSSPVHAKIRLGINDSWPYLLANGNRYMPKLLRGGMKIGR